MRLAIYGIPILAGSVAARLLTAVLNSSAHRVVSLLVVVAATIVTSLAVSRLSTRLLPLALLLRMTMIFPDRAPSRFKVARRTTSVADIQARLESPHLDEKDAAATMLALVLALGRHDRQTRGHSERVRLFTDLLAEQLKLPAADAGRLRWAALIHDIGKLRVPASVLNKPGKPDAREWSLLKAHPDTGATLASPLAEWLGPWFDGIAHHHERYDATGYPRGLGGDEISFAGRAIAVVDSFETMTAARSYKAARSTLSARVELARCAGTHFDPAMVRAFLAIALPRLLWAVGPLAFVVNAPFLRWVGQGSIRLGDAVGTTATGAANLAGVGALAVAIGASPAAGGAAHGHGHGHHHGSGASAVHASSTARILPGPPSPAWPAPAGPAPTGPAPTGPAPTGPAPDGAAVPRPRHAPSVENREPVTAASKRRPTTRTAPTPTPVTHRHQVGSAETHPVEPEATAPSHGSGKHGSGGEHPGKHGSGGEHPGKHGSGGEHSGKHGSGDEHPGEHGSGSDHPDEHGSGGEHPGKHGSDAQHSDAQHHGGSGRSAAGQAGEPHGEHTRWGHQHWVFPIFPRRTR